MEARPAKVCSIRVQPSPETRGVKFFPVKLVSARDGCAHGVTHILHVDVAARGRLRRVSASSGDRELGYCVEQRS